MRIPTLLEIKIEGYLKKDTFANIPKKFQLGFLMWQLEQPYYDIDLSLASTARPTKVNAEGQNVIEEKLKIEIDDWCNDPKVDAMIQEYATSPNHQIVKYGMIPLELMKEMFMPDVIENSKTQVIPITTFEDWHADNKFNNNLHGAAKKDSIIACTIHNEKPYGHFFLDGFYRFHWYVAHGMTEIPVVTWDGHYYPDSHGQYNYNN